MLRDILTIGGKIDMKQLDGLGRPLTKANTYVSQLTDCIDNNVIQIAAPMKYGRVILPQSGESYNLCFYTKGGLYQCNCVILRDMKENNTILVEARLTTDLEKFQRRQYYRLDCVHEIYYRPVSKEEEELQIKLDKNDYINEDERNKYRKRLSELDQTWNKASIVDLSGGGARFNSEKRHNEGEKIRIKLDLDLSGRLQMMNIGAVIISSNRIMNQVGIYENRAEFNNISKREREVLVQYIFEQERKRRKKQ